MNVYIQLKYVSFLLFISTITLIPIECSECKHDTGISIRFGSYRRFSRITCVSVTIDSQHSIKSLIVNDNERAKGATEIIVTKSNIPVLVNSIFDTFKEVRVLQLNEDNVTDIQPNAFIGMKLEEIRISNNKLTKIKEHAFAGLDKMYKLDMSFNNLTILENINEMTSLLELNVTNNNLVKINENCFKGMADLEKLDLSYNNLTTLENLNGLSNLQELNISNNNLLIIKENDFQDLIKLKVLSLFNNKLTTLTHINQIHSLETLNIGFNLIKTVNENDVHSFQSLKSLDLSDNYIKKLNPKLFINLQNLTHLYLRNNTFESFSNNIFYKSINYIDLSTNAMDTIECNQFQGSAILNENYLNDICHFGPNTTSINLGENEIIEIKNGSLAHLTKLTFLNLTRNFIKNINVDAFENLHNLKTLLIRKNAITTIHMGTFFPLKSLEHLDLSYNKIKNFTAGIFTGVNKLKILDLSHNAIVFLDYFIFIHVYGLEELYLHGNPLIFESGESRPTYLKKFSIHFEKIGCTELQDMLEYIDRSKIQRGTAFKGPNVYGIACQPEPEETSSRRRSENEFIMIQSTAFAIHTSLVLIIVLFVILFISHTISWCHNHFISKEYYLKKNGQTCSLTLLTEDDQD